ncbi:MAG TPA: glycosyltransferase family 4 protein [Pyrinomonadaceae bacterium]|nr:glycosyltransferase family 4 protein [Pyrinomonadaceae bacterium]
MRILQVSSARTLGGGERHLADLARGLKARGHTLYAAVRPQSPLRAALDSVPSENFLETPLRNALDLPSALRLARFARERGIQIIHAHMARDYPPAAFACWRAPASRLVLTRHVMFPLGRAHRRALRRVARVVAVSEAVARSLREQRVFPPEKIRVVTNAIEFEEIEARARAFERERLRRELAGDARLIVGTVGDLTPLKGHEEFVRAAAIVAREWGERVVFLVVGEDSSTGRETRARLEQLIDELKLKGRVRLLGRRRDLSEILTALDLFVSASRTEAFGLAIVEAMACGAPALATATDGAREIINDGETGRLTPVGDAEALAANILALLKDETERKRLSEHARAEGRARFGLARMVEATEEVYREALTVP